MLPELDVSKTEGLPELDLSADTGLQLLDVSNAGGLSEIDASVVSDSPVSLELPTRSPSITRLLGAGKDLSDAMMWEGLGAFSEAFGFDEQAAKFKYESEKQERLASRVQPESFLDEVIMASGQIAPSLGGALVGAVAAPAVGLSAGAGATIAGTLASLGLTQGELQMKAQELSPEHKADLAQLAIGGGLALGDALIIGKARKILSPLTKAGGDKIAKNTLNSVMGVGREIAETAVGVGAMEAVQDAGSSVAANLLTDTPIDQKRIDAIVDASVDEFLIGATLGVPFGGVNVAAKSMYESQYEAEQKSKPHLRQELNEETGEMEWVQQVPVEGAAKQPSMFSMAVAPIFGNLSAATRTKLWDNKPAQMISSYFNQTGKDRFKYKHNTVHSNAEMANGELLNFAAEVMDANKQDLKEAWEIKASGDMEAINANPLAKKLQESLGEDILKRYEKSGGTVTEQMKRPDYLPLVAAIDWDKIGKNREEFFGKLKAQALKQGMNDEQIKKLYKKANTLLDNYETEGTIHSYGNKTGLNRSRKRLEALFTDPDATASDKRKALKGMTQRHRSKDTQDSPLTLERGLQELDQSFWESNYIRKGMDPKTRLKLHYKLISEHMAHMEAFGPNNEKFDQMVAEAVLADGDAKSEMTIKEIDRMYDMLSTSQRILLKPISPTLRKWQNRVRAFENITLLGLSVIPSVAETLMIPTKFGAKNTLTALGQAVKYGSQELVRKVGVDIPRNELDRVMTDLNISYREALNVVANRIGEDSINLSKAEEMIIQASGLPLFTTFTQSWAGFAAEAEVKRLASNLTSGKLTSTQKSQAIAKINDAGLDVARTLDWYNNGASKDHVYYSDIKAALKETVNDTIIDPNPSDKSIWFNDERLKLISQLKSFATVFTNRIMLDWYKKGATAANERRIVDSTAHGLRIATFISSYLAMQIGLAGFREYLKTGDTDKWDDKEVYEHLVDSIAYLGSIGFAADPLRAPTYGADPIISLMGPAAGDASRVFKITGTMMSDPERGIEMVVKRMIPNMPAKEPITEGILDLMEDAGIL